MKLTDLSAASIHNILMANENKDTAYLLMQLKMQKLPAEQKQYPKSEEMIEAYNAMQEYASNVPSVYEQTQIITSTMKKAAFHITIFR